MENQKPKTSNATPSGHFPHKLLEDALLTLQDGIVVLSQDGIVQYINKAAQEICFRSYGRRPLPASYFFDNILDENHAKKAKASFALALQNKASERKVQFNIDGVELWFDMGYYPMHSESGHITHVCATAKNITEKVEMERKLTWQRQTQKNEVIRAALEAQEKERSFIGRELHDNVNQVLTTVRLYLDLSLQKDVPEKDIMHKALQHVDYCIDEIRKLSHKLEPFEIEAARDTLQDSLSGLVKSINETKKVNINFFYHGMDKLRISPGMQTAIYRIVQELLTNIIRHAGATLVDFFIVGTSVNLSVRISDNGCGFEMDKVHLGSGINGIRQRVEEMKGELQYTTSTGEGCTVNLRIPLI